MAKFRKVIKTGNSLGITLPKKFLNAINLNEGDIASYEVNLSRPSITFVFTGHPRQLYLIDKDRKID